MKETTFWLLMNGIAFVALTALCAIIGAICEIAEFWTLGYFFWALLAFILFGWLSDAALDGIRRRILNLRRKRND